MSERKGKSYKAGELEIILSLAPTKSNIRWLSELLERTPASIKIVYRIAFDHSDFGRLAKSQEQKILDAKARVGIDIGRKKVRKAEPE